MFVISMTVTRMITPIVGSVQQLKTISEISDAYSGLKVEHQEVLWLERLENSMMLEYLSSRDRECGVVRDDN